MIRNYNIWGGWFKNSNRRRKQLIRLETKNGINHDAKVVFMYGQCHSLAVAIHDLTGWELWQVEGENHVVCFTPFDEIIDIKGVSHPRDCCDCDFDYSGNGECECQRRITRDEALKLSGYMKCEPSKAKPFALMVLNTYYPNWKREIIH